MRFSIAVTALLANTRVLAQGTGMEPMINEVMQGIEDAGKALTDIADAFYSNPDKFMTDIKDGIMKAVNDDIDRNERDWEQAQNEVENWWEQVTWRAAEVEVPPHMEIYAPPADNECWQKVQRVVDAINIAGQDPSGDMKEARETEIAKRREGAEQLDAALEQWKQQVLDELHE